MAYKAKFKGVEIFHNKNWTPLDQNEGYAANASSTDFTSLSAQVAEISMPNMTLFASVSCPVIGHDSTIAGNQNSNNSPTT